MIRNLTWKNRRRQPINKKKVVEIASTHKCFGMCISKGNGLALSRRSLFFYSGTHIETELLKVIDE